MIPVVVAALMFAAVVDGTQKTPPSLGGFVVLFAVTFAGGLWARSKWSGKHRLAGRSVRMRGHSHRAAGPLTARHEGGHMAAARRLGGRVVSARADEHGGFVDAVVPDDPVKRVAFWYAGQYAAGTGRGSGEDNALIAAELHRVPSPQRNAVRRDGQRLARKIVGSSGARIDRDARRLQERGRL